jgi:hypothetical protein
VEDRRQGVPGIGKARIVPPDIPEDGLGVIRDRSCVARGEVHRPAEPAGDLRIARGVFPEGSRVDSGHRSFIDRGETPRGAGPAAVLHRIVRVGTRVASPAVNRGRWLVALAADHRLEVEVRLAGREATLPEEGRVVDAAAGLEVSVVEARAHGREANREEGSPGIVPVGAKVDSLVADRGSSRVAADPVADRGEIVGENRGADLRGNSELHLPLRPDAPTTGRAASD